MSCYHWNAPNLIMKNQMVITRKYPTIKAQFMAGIELGVLSKNCKNFGICRITPISQVRAVRPVEKKRKGCNCQCRHSCKGIVTLLDNELVEIHFLRSSIGRASFKKYFLSGHFLIEEDFFYIDEIEAAVQFGIAKGAYPVQLVDGLVKVTCPTLQIPTSDGQPLTERPISI